MLTRPIACFGVAAVVLGCGGQTPARHPEVVVRLRATGRATAAELDMAESILRARLHGLGVKPATVTRRGRVFDLGFPTSRHARRFASIATKEGRLEVFDLEPSLVGGPTRVRPQPRGRTRVVTCTRTAPTCPDASGAPGLPPARAAYYVLRVPAALAGADLRRSSVRMDFDATGRPTVVMSFTHAGDRKFARLTRAEWQRGRERGAPQHFAIVVDGELLSFPQIDFTDTTLRNGITGGVQFTGLTSVRNAKDLALVLATGPLPVRLVRAQ